MQEEGEDLNDEDIFDIEDYIGADGDANVSLLRKNQVEVTLPNGTKSFMYKATVLRTIMAEGGHSLSKSSERLLRVTGKW